MPEVFQVIGVVFAAFVVAVWFHIGTFLVRPPDGADDHGEPDPIDEGKAEERDLRQKEWPGKRKGGGGE